MFRYAFSIVIVSVLLLSQKAAAQLRNRDIIIGQNFSLGANAAFIVNNLFKLASGKSSSPAPLQSTILKSKTSINNLALNRFAICSGLELEQRIIHNVSLTGNGSFLIQNYIDKDLDQGRFSPGGYKAEVGLRYYVLRNEKMNLKYLNGWYANLSYEYVHLQSDLESNIISGTESVHRAKAGVGYQVWGAHGVMFDMFIGVSYNWNKVWNADLLSTKLPVYNRNWLFPCFMLSSPVTIGHN